MIRDVENPPKKVLKWIERLKKCMKACPEGIWFFSDGGLHIMAHDRNGDEVYTDTGGVDPGYVLDSLSDHIYEGGDW